MIRDAQSGTPVEENLNVNTPVAIDLALIEMIKHSSVNLECASEAAFAWCFNQRDHPTRIAICSSMFVRALPKATFPAAYMSATHLFIREILSPNQRAIAEDPNRFAGFYGALHPFLTHWPTGAGTVRSGFWIRRSWKSCARAMIRSRSALLVVQPHNRLPSQLSQRRARISSSQDFWIAEPRQKFRWDKSAAMRMLAMRSRPKSKRFGGAP
jgi:hypothetical protein